MKPPARDGALTDKECAAAKAACSTRSAVKPEAFAIVIAGHGSTPSGQERRRILAP
jgi:hypothetical protein